jgi:glutamine synthetase
LEWAKAQGVTHYTFWVQPFTNETLEKHDAFFELEYVYNGSESSKGIDKFNGKTLIKGEADGSSVPHGGLRGTEAARAYIAWDHHSNMFIR